MIGNADNLLESYTNAPQLTNLWDLIITDWNEQNVNINKFKVISTNLPYLVSLETGKYETIGTHYYNNFVLPETISITFREDTKFSTYTYFKNWLDKIFDLRTGTFVSSSETKTREAIITMYSYKMNKEYFTLKASLENRLRQKANSVTESIIEETKERVRKHSKGFLSLGGEMFNTRGLTQLSSGINDLLSANKEYFDETISKAFLLKKLRFLSIEETPLTYDAADELTLTVNFTIDSIEDLKI